MSKEEFVSYLATEAQKMRGATEDGGDVTGACRIIADLGFDSLDYATLMLSCESWSGVCLSERQIDWSKVQTIDELAALFAEA